MEIGPCRLVHCKHPQQDECIYISDILVVWSCPHLHRCLWYMDFPTQVSTLKNTSSTTILRRKPRLQYYKNPLEIFNNSVVMWTTAYCKSLQQIDNMNIPNRHHILKQKDSFMCDFESPKTSQFQQLSFKMNISERAMFECYCNNLFLRSK